MRVDNLPVTVDFSEENGLLAGAVQCFSARGQCSSNRRVHDGPSEVVALEMNVYFGKSKGKIRYRVLFRFNMALYQIPPAGILTA